MNQQQTEELIEILNKISIELTRVNTIINKLERKNKLIEEMIHGKDNLNNDGLM